MFVNTAHVTVTILLVYAAMGCATQLPKPELLPSAADSYVEVPYPPPAAAAEIVPARPTPAAVWVDGQWSWRGRYFVWQRGGWVVPPKNAYFSRWSKRYGKDGALYFAEPTWRTREGRKLPSPRVLRPAGTPPTRETPEVVAAP